MNILRAFVKDRSSLVDRKLVVVNLVPHVSGDIESSRLREVTCDEKGSGVSLENESQSFSKRP